MPEVTMKVSLELSNEAYMRGLDYYMEINTKEKLFQGEGGFERCLAALLDLALQNPTAL